MAAPAATPRIRRVDLRESPSDAPIDYRRVVPRADFDVEAATHAVRPILEAVRDRGQAAVREFTARFDGVESVEVAVPPLALRNALDALAPDVRSALEESIRRLRATCVSELESDTVTRVATGAVVTQRKTPIDRVGLYVPGGVAPLVSSVVMNVVPAQVAGVASVALAAPPQKDNGGLPDATTLAACALLGVDEVYAVGGAQAVAMLAYGTEICPPVDLITGPGNIFVTAAKRLLRGVVGIDSEAGPSEVLVLADATADPAYIASDLISQAEHGESSAAVLVTDSDEVASAVEAELDRQLSETKHVTRIATALAAAQSAIVLVTDVDQGLEVVNAYATEHLEILTRDASEVATRVRNAGAIFLGPFTPVSLGDYCAGSNHVLPTAGCAYHSSGLSVRAFLKTVHVVDYSRVALEEVAPHVMTLAEAEDLPAHGAAVRARLRDG